VNRVARAGNTRLRKKDFIVIYTKVANCLT
jgi:hypothetical protein